MLHFACFMRRGNGAILRMIPLKPRRPVTGATLRFGSLPAQSICTIKSESVHGRIHCWCNVEEVIIPGVGLISLLF